MRRVVIESPYAGDLQIHGRYLNNAIRDCLRRGESPYASHRMFTEALDDKVAAERKLGITAGQEWARLAHAFVVYRDLGISPGMVEGIKWAMANGYPVEYRNIEGWTDGKVE